MIALRTVRLNSVAAAISLGSSLQTGALSFAFTKNSDDPQCVTVYRSRDGTTTRLPSGYAVQQWSETFKRMILIHNGAVYAWRLGETPASILRLPSDLALENGFVTVAVDPTGKSVAVEDSDHNLSVVSIGTNRTILSLSAGAIKRQIPNFPLAITDLLSVAWNPSGAAVAITWSGKSITGRTDGASYSYCIIADLKGRVRMATSGCPVSWISRREILLKEETLKEETHGEDSTKFRPLIWDTSKMQIRRCPHVGDEVGWDGTHILLVVGDSIELLSQTFSVIHRYNLPKLFTAGWADNGRTCFVGVP